MHDDICMFCKRGDLEFISTSYKNVGGSIHDQITEIFGDVVNFCTIYIAQFLINVLFRFDITLKIILFLVLNV